jgi:hypothetical protein
MLLTIQHQLKRLLKTHMLLTIQHQLNQSPRSQLQYNLPHLQHHQFQQLAFHKDGLWNNGSIMAHNT